MNIISDTIAAIATAQGIGAIGVIRLSGPKAFSIANKIFKGRNLEEQPTHSLHFGTIVNSENEIIDEVVVSLFKGPKSYTGEHVVEISGHGSPYVLQSILQLCLDSGARMALPGEFTQRAFLNGKMDLAQAEAVADLIAADSFAAQQTALNQLRGGFSGDLKQLREELIHFAAMIELELDFPEEDVTFADRTELFKLIDQLTFTTSQLIHSFKLGNVIKNGVSVAIIGQPNAGKSTLLNALLNEERAIVSEIAGTTRDTIEETLNINGVMFRLVDTAGIREHTLDVIEQIGVGRSLEKMRQADIVVALFDVKTFSIEDLQLWKETMTTEQINFILVGNKIDEMDHSFLTKKYKHFKEILFISAKEKLSIDNLQNQLFEKVIEGQINTENTIVTNTRHHEALKRVEESLKEIRMGMDQEISGELLALDIRRCLHFLGEITGQVEVDRDILGTIFGKFCIGK